MKIITYLLNTASHLADIAGTENASKVSIESHGYKQRASIHHGIGSIISCSLIANQDKY